MDYICINILPKPMSTSRQRVLQALQHEQPDLLPVDFGATSVTGIHCKIVEALRAYYGLEKRPVKIVEPFQMLGEIDDELKQIMHIDCEAVFGNYDMLGNDCDRLHLQRTLWGQEVLIAEGIELTPDSHNDIWLHPQGDKTLAPSAVLPESCYFMNAVERCDGFDESNLNVEDNLEEFAILPDDELDRFAARVARAASTGRAVVASIGGSALGDVALVPGVSLRAPRGIRSVAEWYISILMRPDYIREVFERQTEIAIDNYRRVWERCGHDIDVVFTCGTDFGTQNSQFCSVGTFREIWFPYYKRLNDWIHENTSWKIFKHSCGAMLPLLDELIAAGFDIFNPVQINARDMDSKVLKERFGDRIVFWGGGIDTQKVLPFGTPNEVRAHVREQCRIFGEKGGFVFSSVHNIQANVPVENVVAMIEELNAVRNL